MQLSYRGLQSIGIHRMLILDQLFWRCVKEAGWSTLAIRAALKLLNMIFFKSFGKSCISLKIKKTYRTLNI